MSESKLLPCPFCGDEYNADAERRFDGDFFVECGNMDCEVQPITNDFPTKGEAIKAWNTRAAPTYNPETHILIAKADVPEGLFETIRAAPVSNGLTIKCSCGRQSKWLIDVHLLDFEEINCKCGAAFKLERLKK